MPTGGGALNAAYGLDRNRWADSGGRFVCATCGLGVEDAILIEPNGVYGQETMEVLCGIPLLVIDEPELAVRAGDDAMVARPEHIPAPMGDGVARLFHKRASGRF